MAAEWWHHLHRDSGWAEYRLHVKIGILAQNMRDDRDYVETRKGDSFPPLRCSLEISLLRLTPKLGSQGVFV